MNFVKDIIDYITKLFTWWIVVMPWEQGLRVTLGKKVMVINEGIWLRVPLIHKCYVQEKRLRVISLPIQTISTKDGHAITVSCSAGYSIIDIFKLYNTLYQPDLTIGNIIATKIATHISGLEMSECHPKVIEDAINDGMKEVDYGLKFEHVRIVNFASVKTFRLIQDQSYMYEGLSLTQHV